MVRRLWVEFMTAHNIFEYTPGQAANFVDNPFGQPGKEEKKRPRNEEREEKEDQRRALLSYKLFFLNSNTGF